jgi:hypothetical protein
MTCVFTPAPHGSEPLFRVPYASIAEVWRTVRYVLTNDARGRLVGGGTPCVLTAMRPEVPVEDVRDTTLIPALFPVLLGKAPHSAFLYSVVKVSFHLVPSEFVGVRDYETVGVFVHCEGSSAAEAYVKQLLKCAVAAREPMACLTEFSGEVAEEVGFWFPDVTLEPEVGAWRTGAAGVAGAAGVEVAAGAGGRPASIPLDRLLHMAERWKTDLEGGRAAADVCCAILTACNNGTAGTAEVLKRVLFETVHKVAVGRTGTYVGVLAAMATRRLGVPPPLGSAPTGFGASAPTPKVVFEEQQMWYDLQRAVCGEAPLV